jgi:hypothetical protein
MPTPHVNLDIGLDRRLSYLVKTVQFTRIVISILTVRSERKKLWEVKEKSLFCLCDSIGPSNCVDYWGIPRIHNMHSLSSLHTPHGLGIIILLYMYEEEGTLPKLTIDSLCIVNIYYLFITILWSISFIVLSFTYTICKEPKLDAWRFQSATPANCQYDCICQSK